MVAELAGDPVISGAVQKGVEDSMEKGMRANAACLVQHPFAIFDLSYHGIFQPGNSFSLRGADAVQQWLPVPDLKSEKSK
jgi:hypothetical protein